MTKILLYKHTHTHTYILTVLYIIYVEILPPINDSIRKWTTPYKPRYQITPHLLSQLAVRAFQPLTTPLRLVASSISSTWTFVTSFHSALPSLS